MPGCYQDTQYEQALQEQEEQEMDIRPLSQFLIDRGYVTETQLQTALKIHKKIKHSSNPTIYI